MSSNYWDRWNRSRANRRAFLTGAGAVGLGATGIVLTGCGGDDDDDAPAATATTGGSASATTGTGTSTSSSPAASASAAVTRGGTARYPMGGLSSGNPPTLFPFENLTYLTQTPAGYMYSRLVRGVGGPDIDVNDNTAMEGDFTTGWEQPDELTYTFKIKPGAKWQNKAPMNGRAITATDFLKTWEAFKGISQNAAVWTAVIDKVEAADDSTIKITLKAPYAPFLITHASSPEGLWFIPAETIDNDQVKTDPVGSGPYLFDKFESGVAMYFSKNPDYYDAPLPNFDKIEAGMLADPQRLVAALQSGDYDMSGLSGSIYRDSRSKLDKDGTDFFTRNIALGAFYFNFDNKPFDDVRVRQALSMALDRDGYLKVQDGTGKGDYHSFLPPGLAPYYLSPRDQNAAYGDKGKFWKRDVKEAKALLQAATGSDTLKFNLHANVDRYGAEMQAALELFVSTIKEAGFEAELVLEEYGSYIQSTYLGKIRDGCAAGPLIGSPRDPDNMFLQFWSGSARHNYGGSIPEQTEIDNMIVKQRTILDNKERVKYIQDMQVTMSQWFQTVPYHASAGFVYAQPWVKNYYYKAGYSYLPDSLMKANFTEERIKKG